MAHVVVMALSTDVPGIEAVDNIDTNNYEEVNRLFEEQVNQLAITDTIRGQQQRQLALLAAARRDSANLRNQRCDRCHSCANKMTRQPSPTASPTPAWGAALASDSVSIGGADMAYASPSVELAAAETEVKIDISNDNPEVGMETDILDNPAVSSSGEPSTVGAGVVTTSAVPTAVQVSPATT